MDHTSLFGLISSEIDSDLNNFCVFLVPSCWRLETFFLHKFVGFHWRLTCVRMSVRRLRKMRHRFWKSTFSRRLLNCRRVCDRHFVCNVSHLDVFQRRGSRWICWRFYFVVDVFDVTGVVGAGRDGVGVLRSALSRWRTMKTTKIRI
jgi:hypothetical protein